MCTMTTNFLRQYRDVKWEQLSEQDWENYNLERKEHDEVNIHKKFD